MLAVESNMNTGFFGVAFIVGSGFGGHCLTANALNSVAYILLRILQLLANGHSLACTNEFGQICVEIVVSE